ncbi:thiol peroxidase [Neorhodopirellula lusitana]|uniref:thiol peroxidase n=1 Tax=Neorhodopirellula lusitana TaxID=445327 RepID=UPI0024B6FBAF|nr:thiol peroxidase [Neorhodopirellula lusitana]
MANITLKGNPIESVGELPDVGTVSPDFELTKTDLSEISLADLKGKTLVLNIFPSVDTSTCAMSVRQFNEKAASLNNAVVLCVSADLPFAIKRFCGAEGIENVEAASSFRTDFGKDYGVTIKTGPLRGLLSRAVVVVDADGKVIYKEQVGEITDEPNYESALAAIS